MLISMQLAESYEKIHETFQSDWGITELFLKYFYAFFRPLSEHLKDDEFNVSFITKSKDLHGSQA